MRRLSQKQLAWLRAELEERRAELRHAVISLREEAHEALANLDRSDVFDEEPSGDPDVERTFQVADAAAERLVEVEAALERLDNGTYGTCEVCGELIAIERLEALPETRMCLECRREAERTGVGVL